MPDLSLPEWLDAAVAAGTLALAAATAWMAWKVRDQADQTRRLAEIAERQLEVTTTPVVRVMRVAEHPGQADIVTVNQGARDETLTVRLENRGATAAGIERCTMTPGGPGALSTDSGLESPVLEPNGEWDVDFRPSASDKERHARGSEVLVQVVYKAVGSGAQYRRRTYVKRDLKAPHERWVILREAPPERLSVTRPPSS